MREHGIDVLVTKDSGGPLTSAKLAAARAEGVQVLVVRRPPLPPGVDAVDTVEAALARVHPSERRSFSVIYARAFAWVVASGQQR